VQEFQFGMNWADYSRFVGDVFGAPLAMEGLLAFFMESVFLGLWIFGWDRLPKKIHLMTIWAAALGTLLSSYFILAANSWMQHPVGFEINPDTGRAVLNDIGAVLFQNTAVLAFFHTMSASFMVAGTGVAVVGAWFLIKNRQTDIFRPAIKAGAVVTLIAAAAVSLTGDMTSKVMVEQQPMKMAAAEALYETAQSAPFSVLTIGDVSGENATPILEIPGLLSFLSTGSFDGTVEGINDLQAQYEETYGPGNYVPYVPVTYWGFRLMIGLGMLGAAWSLWALWRFRGKRNPEKGRLFAFSTLFVMLGPLFGISAGWIFTEMGRQPWVVFGEQLTANGVSTSISTTEVWISLIGFTLVYGILAVIEIKLLLKYIKAGAPETVVEDPYEDAASNDKLYFAY